ncbi:5-methyltetrahydropteroyltriglutamate--homocysteine methyltransferase [Roseomonas aerophila]|uniref:5-methyltetrahydropteroyltriglutamate--homocysteine methyltransferase n=1 Tax=Teichococcus aerophilus TaxID=1224513 RepID=A0ABR7RGG5_9PROT|nr:5-methyltetrahydropteroyltriglutamate--homocysteine methyltransferase [Pseudoroseomonas aerophila]MBC9205637.1 5-methyltetrahydropteroyltriglutamate--homocysteine methyltransferase [Pseudoroseomonas aerophila]
MSDILLPTTVVGSYPQPDWLVDRNVLAQNLVPRVRMKQMWRVAEDALEQAQDDATLVAIRDMERAGIDIVTDGEIRRESYSNRFALALDGVDVDNPARTMGRAGKETLVPRVVGAIRRNRPVEVRDVEFLVANTDKRTKITLPGPFTLSQQASDEFYKDEEALAMAYAAAVNEEAKDLRRAGVNVIQFDEPWMQARPDAAARFGVKALNRALEGLDGDTVVHLCFGYAAVVKDKPSGYSFLPQLADCTAAQISIEAAQPKLDLSVLDELPNKTIMLGVIDLGSESVETAEMVAERIRAGLRRLPAERLVLAPDCGMKYLPRPRAFAKLQALAAGAAIVRRELQG